MLIVHDGGGCQVEFKDLAEALSVEQRRMVEEELRYYVERTEWLEKVKAEREAFEMAQREKGRVEFEGAWVTPLEREKIVLNRAEQKLELERKRLQLVQEKAAFEKEQLQKTETVRYLLEGESRRATTFTYGYYTPYNGDCIYPVPYRYKNGCTKPVSLSLNTAFRLQRSDINRRTIPSSLSMGFLPIIEAFLTADDRFLQCLELCFHEMMIV